MKTDLEADYDEAKRKRSQLEDEIRKYLPYDGVAKANMLHTLSKLWISVQNIHDRAAESSGDASRVKL